MLISTEHFKNIQSNFINSRFLAKDGDLLNVNDNWDNQETELEEAF